MTTSHRKLAVRAVQNDFISLMKAVKPDIKSVGVLVDTNVMMEIDSFGDLLKLADKLRSVEAIAACSEFRYRQLRSRYSNLLAWWFRQTGTVGGMLGTEVLGKLKSDLAPEGDPRSHNLTTGIVEVILPFVLKDMRIGPLIEVDHFASSNDADTELLRIAKAENLPLVTNEGLTQSGLTETKKNGERNLRGRCRDAGIDVYSPEEFLAYKGVEVTTEARRFCDACSAGVHEAAARGVLMRTATGREVMSHLVGVYRWIMLDAVDEKYAHLKWAT
jgi:hypothetical protein